MTTNRIFLPPGGRRRPEMESTPRKQLPGRLRPMFFE